MKIYKLILKGQFLRENFTDMSSKNSLVGSYYAFIDIQFQAFPDVYHDKNIGILISKVCPLDGTF